MDVDLQIQRVQLIFLGSDLTDPRPCDLNLNHKPRSG